MTIKPRMTCPTCGRDVAAIHIRDPRVNPGRYGAIPAIRKPVRHKRAQSCCVELTGQLIEALMVSDEWCPAGEGRAG